MKVSQPKANPTNKLSAATITYAVMELARFLVQHYAPQWYDAAVWAAVTPIVAFAVAYYVKDEANV